MKEYSVALLRSFIPRWYQQKCAVSSQSVQERYNLYSNYHRLSSVSAAAPGNYCGIGTRLEQSLTFARLYWKWALLCLVFLLWNKYLSVHWLLNLSALLWKSYERTILLFIYSESTISREYQCSISNAFFRRLMFAFDNIHLYLTLHMVNFWKQKFIHSTSIFRRLELLQYKIYSESVGRCAKETPFLSRINFSRIIT